MDLNHTASLLKTSDDVLEHIVFAAVQNANGCCRHQSVVTLSHVCTRLRQVILSRATFWNSLMISATTSSSAVEAILHRSQSVPLHICILGLDYFKRPRNPGIVLETLFATVAERIADADDLRIHNFEPPESDIFSRACELVNPAGHNFRVRRLVLAFSSFADHFFSLVVGKYLAALELMQLSDPLVPTLSMILHLAPNLEIIRIFGYQRGIEASGSHIKNPPAIGTRLQIVQFEAFGVRGTDIARAIEMVRQYSPQSILEGQLVELRDPFISDACITSMELDRFSDVQSIICDGGYKFTIQYPAWTLPTKRSVGRYALEKLEQQPVRFGLITRGFDAALHNLQVPISLARQVLRRSVIMARSLTMRHTSPSRALELFTILAHDAWPTLEHISLELFIDPPGRADAPVSQDPLKNISVVNTLVSSYTLYTSILAENTGSRLS